MSVESYTKMNWKDGAEGGTPINATNLNHMDNQIVNLTSAAQAAESDIESLESTTSSHTTSINTLNTNMGGVRFGYDTEGNYGYYKVGADTLIPFNSVINLGNGTLDASTFTYTFNVSEIYADYENLTVDNFLVVTDGTVAEKGSGTATTSTQYARGYSKYEKTVTYTDGVLSVMSKLTARCRGTGTYDYEKEASSSVAIPVTVYLARNIGEQI